MVHDMARGTAPPHFGKFGSTKKEREDLRLSCKMRKATVVFCLVGSWTRDPDDPDKTIELSEGTVCVAMS